MHIRVEEQMTGSQRGTDTLKTARKSSCHPSGISLFRETMLTRQFLTLLHNWQEPQIIGEVKAGWAAGMAVTFDHVLTSEPKETVAGTPQEGALVAGKSNTTMLAFQEHLSLGCPALCVMFTADVCVV